MQPLDHGLCVNGVFGHVLEKIRKEVGSKSSGGMEIILSSLEVQYHHTESHPIISAQVEVFLLLIHLILSRIHRICRALSTSSRS